MLNSARRNIAYPNPDRSDRPDIPAHIGNLIPALELDMIYAQGTNAARLARAHLVGTLFYETDTTLTYYDDGVNWQQVGQKAGLVKLWDSTEAGVVFPTASFTTSTLPQTYKNLIIAARFRDSNATLLATTPPWLRINGDTGTHYWWSNSGAQSGWGLYTVGANAVAGVAALNRMWIPDYASAAKHDAMSQYSYKDEVAANYSSQASTQPLHYDQAVAISTLTFVAITAFVAPSRVTIYAEA